MDLWILLLVLCQESTTASLHCQCCSGCIPRWSRSIPASSGWHGGADGDCQPRSDRAPPQGADAVGSPQPLQLSQNRGPGSSSCPRAISGRSDPVGTGRPQPIPLPQLLVSAPHTPSPPKQPCPAPSHLPGPIPGPSEPRHRREQRLQLRELLQTAKHILESSLSQPETAPSIRQAQGESG